MSELTKVRKSVIDPAQVIPDMAGQSGKVLSTDGTKLKWVWGRIVGEICRFSFDTPPAGFFALDGSRIVNGTNDFPALANCGSRFITISGNDLILKDLVDFGRGKGSSGRSVGSFEGDAIRNITGDIGNNLYSYGWAGTSTWSATGAFRNSSDTGPVLKGQVHEASPKRFSFDASRVVPTSSENRPKSLTELVCIYHGVL